MSTTANRGLTRRAEKVEIAAVASQILNRRACLAELRRLELEGERLGRFYVAPAIQRHTWATFWCCAPRNGSRHEEREPEAYYDWRPS
jgi:hypothetical protein